jgi:hypothetical protein
MREECKNFQSRTYAGGEVARFCLLDLAPEAPWRCPNPCSAYERRLADVGWEHGSLVEPAIEDEPSGSPDEIAELLGRATDIVNEVAPGVLAQVEEQERSEEIRARRWWRRRR